MPVVRAGRLAYRPGTLVSGRFEGFRRFRRAGRVGCPWSGVFPGTVVKGWRRPAGSRVVVALSLEKAWSRFDSLRRLSDRQAARLPPARESLLLRRWMASPPATLFPEVWPCLWALGTETQWFGRLALEVPFARTCTDPQRWPSVKGVSSPAPRIRGANDVARPHSCPWQQSSVRVFESLSRPGRMALRKKSSEKAEGSVKRLLASLAKPLAWT